MDILSLVIGFACGAAVVIAAIYLYSEGREKAEREYLGKVNPAIKDVDEVTGFRHTKPGRSGAHCNRCGDYAVGHIRGFSGLYCRTCGLPEDHANA